jgi:lipoprotein NlpI
MDDPGTFAILTFFGTAFLGIAIGALVARLTRFEVGMATGLLIMSVGGLAGAVRLTLINLENAKGTVIATGKLVEYVSEASSTTDSSGRTSGTRSYGPLVEFIAADGKAYRVKGLGSSSQSLEIGTAVSVRYPPADPAKALIADFQNQWGGVFALALFGGFPLLGGLFFLFTAIGGARVQYGLSVRDARPSAWVAWCESRGKRIGGNLNLIAALGMIGAILYAALGGEARDAGFAFVGVAAAASLYAVSFLISNGGWQAVFMCVIIAAGFGAFGIGTVLLTQPAADAKAAKKVLPAVSGSGQIPEDFGVCAGSEGTADQRIAACTRAIASEQLSQEKLSKTFHSRGVEWIGKRDYDRAIADYDEAIRLDPHDALAYYNRGVAWHGKHDYDRAIVDYDQTIRLDPQSPQAFKNRGYSRFLRGNFAESSKDLAETLRLTPGDADAARWQFLARARAGDIQGARAELRGAKINPDGKTWPGPVIGFLLGRMDVNALLQSAEHQDAKVRAEQVCEAEFFAGQWELIQGRANEARNRLQRAAQSCPKDFLEYEGAAAELRRLGS